MLPAIALIVVMFVAYGLLRQNTKCHGCGGCTGSCHSSEPDHDHR
jgi:heterodisulfide reductase subunit C